MTQSNESGFTFVELMVAVLVFAVGMVGFAGTTSLLIRQTTMADLRTERMVAVVSTVERLKALPYDSVLAGSDSVGHFEVSWSAAPAGNTSKLVSIITVGPGAHPTPKSPMPVMSTSVADTFSYRIVKP